jgi:hypothetical protein
VIQLRPGDAPSPGVREYFGPDGKS